MDSWKLVRADDLIDFNPQESISKGVMTKKIAMEHLQPFTRDILTYEITPFNGGSRFRNGDTLMARITPCLENGKTAQVKSLDDGEIGFGSTEFIVMRAKPDISDKDFIYYLAMSPLFRDKAIKSMVGSSGRQRVQQGVLNSIELLVPSLEEQVEIGCTLRTLDDKIANNNKINHHLEQMAQAIFKSWFVDNASDSWENVDLGIITHEIRTKVKEQQLQVLSAVKTGNLVLSEDYFTKQVYSKDISKYIVVEPDDFAYNPARINIGSVGINSFDFAGCVSPVYVVFRTKPEYHHFLSFFLKSPNFQEEVRVRASGSVRQSLNYGDFALIQITYPPLDLIREFNYQYESILEVTRQIDLENIILSEVRDSLLPRLMSGEISVDDLCGDK
jgi:type I restriction enzyme S subunit